MFFVIIRLPPTSTLFPYTTLFRSLLQSGKSADLAGAFGGGGSTSTFGPRGAASALSRATRSEEHTSELQSRQYLVCRLLLEKKKIIVEPGRFFVGNSGVLLTRVLY